MINLNALLVALGGEVKLSDIEELTKNSQMTLSEAIQEASSQKIVQLIGELKADVDRLKEEVDTLKDPKCGCHNG